MVDTMRTTGLALVALGTPQFGSGLFLEPYAPHRHLAVDVTRHGLAPVDQLCEPFAREAAVALGERGDVRHRLRQAEGLGPIALAVIAMAVCAIHVEVGLARDSRVGGLLGLSGRGKDTEGEESKERRKPAESHDD